MGRNSVPVEGNFIGYDLYVRSRWDGESLTNMNAVQNTMLRSWYRPTCSPNPPRSGDRCSCYVFGEQDQLVPVALGKELAAAIAAPARSERSSQCWAYGALRPARDRNFYRDESREEDDQSAVGRQAASGTDTFFLGAAGRTAERCTRWNPTHAMHATVNNSAARPAKAPGPRDVTEGINCTSSRSMLRARRPERRSRR